jgi:fructokinase
MKLYGGVEAGGTKFVCVAGSGPQDIRAEERFATSDPQQTLSQTVDFFRRHGAGIAGVGVACFGPVDLDPASPTYGYITKTPKPGWSDSDVAGTLRRELGLPVAFDTDVNGAALGEATWGAGRGCDPLLYFTIGTGVGGGLLINSGMAHGLVHPEMGHIRLPHDWQADPFPGVCPYHGDCFEGLACGPAMGKRWGQPAETLPADHPAWDLEAQYIALALASLTCAISPRRIILGGGVMQQPGLIAHIRQKTLALLNGYVRSAVILDHIDEYIVLPGLGNRAGMLGALALAKRAQET